MWRKHHETCGRGGFSLQNPSSPPQKHPSAIQPRHHHSPTRSRSLIAAQNSTRYHQSSFRWQPTNRSTARLIITTRLSRIVSTPATCICQNAHPGTIMVAASIAVWLFDVPSSWRSWPQYLKPSVWCGYLRSTMQFPAARVHYIRGSCDITRR